MYTPTDQPPFQRNAEPQRRTPGSGSRPMSSTVVGNSRGTCDPLSSQPQGYFEGRPQIGQTAALARTQSRELKDGLASPVLPENVLRQTTTQPTTELRAGLIQKPFYVPTDLLIATSPYFADLANPKQSIVDVPPPNLPGPFFFPDLDEYAMALFMRWLYTQSNTTKTPSDTASKELHGPTDFHSMNHYLCLYVLALRFQLESLRNTIMDLVRGYYRRENMTAPAFRLEYVYANTDGSCFMREFLVGTAAYRALADAQGAGANSYNATGNAGAVDRKSGGRGKGLSESMKGVLRGGGDLSVDFVESVLGLAGAGDGSAGRVDGRHGSDCRWHEHAVTEVCGKAGGAEPYEGA